MAVIEAGDEVVEALDLLVKVSKMKTISETIKITEGSRGEEATTGGGAEEEALNLTERWLLLTLDRRSLQSRAGEGEEAIPGEEEDLTVKGEEEVDLTTVKEEGEEDSRIVEEEGEEDSRTV